jgi:hypothetical protein
LPAIDLPGTASPAAGSADASPPGGGFAAEPPSPAELNRVVQRALEFQGYLLRRAWALYYLTWAVVLTVLFVVPGVLAGPLASPTTVEIVLYNTLQAAAIVAAIWATWWAVAQSARTGRLRDTLEGRALSRRWFLQILAWAVAITVLVVAVGFVSAFAGLLVLDATLGGIVLWLLIQVRPWFQPVPLEATIAVGSYAVSVGGSAIALVLTHNQLVFSAGWIIAPLAWAFAGVYALYHAPEELTRGTGA